MSSFRGIASPSVWAGRLCGVNAAGTKLAPSTFEPISGLSVQCGGYKPHLESFCGIADP